MKQQLTIKDSYIVRFYRGNKFCELATSVQNNFQTLKKHLRLVCLNCQFNKEYMINSSHQAGSKQKVYSATKLASKQLFTVIMYDKRSMFNSKSSRNRLKKKISVLKTINNFGFIKLYEIYEEELTVYLVLEYVKGPTLFQTKQMRF